MSITFLIEKILHFHSLRSSPMSKIGGRLFVRKRKQRNLHYLQSHPLGVLSWMLLRNNTSLLEFMMTYIQDGPHYDKKGTKQCQSSPMSSIPFTPSWLSKTLSNIWCSSTTTVYIYTSRHKWILWTYLP
jgi:hypothetical protein